MYPKHALAYVAEICPGKCSKERSAVRKLRKGGIAKVGGHDRPTINQDMDLVFDMSKIHFFDKDTDNTIV